MGMEEEEEDGDGEVSTSKQRIFFFCSDVKFLSFPLVLKHI